MISKSNCLSSSITRSSVAPLVSANSADVPGVTFSRTVLMKSSSIPTSTREPLSPPIAAPMAIPSSGIKKIRPNRKPQNAPPTAPAPPVLDIWRVWGFLRSAGQVTTAASCRVISCLSCMPCKASSTRSAPLGSLNFSTDSVANAFLLFLSLGARCCDDIAGFEGCSGRRRPPPAVVVVASREQVPLRKAEAERKYPRLWSYRQKGGSSVLGLGHILYGPINHLVWK